jgi:hypothetical protein
LFRLYAYAQRDDLDYNLAFIPRDFTAKSTSEFDSAYMDALFQIGYQMACCGYPWSKYPPDFNPRKYGQPPPPPCLNKERFQESRDSKPVRKILIIIEGCRYEETTT